MASEQEEAPPALARTGDPVQGISERKESLVGYKSCERFRGQLCSGSWWRIRHRSQSDQWHAISISCVCVCSE